MAGLVLKNNVITAVCDHGETEEMKVGLSILLNLKQQPRGRARLRTQLHFEHIDLHNVEPSQSKSSLTTV